MLDNSFNFLSANPSNWSNMQACLSVFDHFVELALKGLMFNLKKYIFPSFNTFCEV